VNNNVTFVGAEKFLKIYITFTLQDSEFLEGIFS